MPPTLLPPEVAPRLVVLQTANKVTRCGDTRAVPADQAMREVRRLIRGGGKLLLDRPSHLVFGNGTEAAYVEGDRDILAAILAATV